MTELQCKYIVGQRGMPPNEERLDRILNYIITYKVTNDGRFPTVREISDELGGVSTSVVNYYLHQLQDNGYLKKGDDYQARGWQVVGGSWSYAPPD